MVLSHGLQFNNLYLATCNSQNSSSIYLYLSSKGQALGTWGRPRDDANTQRPLSFPCYLPKANSVGHHLNPFRLVQSKQILYTCLTFSLTLFCSRKKIVKVANSGRCLKNGSRHLQSTRSRLGCVPRCYGLPVSVTLDGEGGSERKPRQIPAYESWKITKGFRRGSFRRQPDYNLDNKPMICLDSPGT